MRPAHMKGEDWQPSTQPQNIDKVIAAITAKPKLFEMADYAKTFDENGDRVLITEHKCDTIMCICGWANYIRWKETPKAKRLTKVPEYNDQTVAARWLGISERQAEELFYASWLDHRAPSLRARRGARVLRELRDKGSVVWADR